MYEIILNHLNFLKMKINYPSTQDGWIKLGKLISEKNAAPGSDAPVSASDADVAKIGQLALEVEQNFTRSVQLHKDAEISTEAGAKSLTLMQDEVRRTARVLSGRYRNNMKEMGKWGFAVDESAAKGEITEPAAV